MTKPSSYAHALARRCKSQRFGYQAVKAATGGYCIGCGDEFYKQFGKKGCEACRTIPICSVCRTDLLDIPGLGQNKAPLSQVFAMLHFTRPCRYCYDKEVQG